MNPQEVDVVIIGAGASGLVAAYKLLTKDPSINVIILEAKGRVGGRLHSINVPCANGTDTWDFGGQWVSSSQLVILRLLKEFKFEYYPQYMTGKHQLVRYDWNNIRSYSGLIPNFGYLELLSINNLMEKIELLAKMIPLNNPVACEQAREWDKMTLHSYIEKQTSSPVVQALLSVAVRTVFGCESSQLSFFYFLYYCALAGGFNTLLDTCKGAAQEYRVKGTVGNFIKELAKAVGLEKIIFDDPVLKIEQCSDSSVRVESSKGCVYRTKYVISAIPTHLISQIRFDPLLPHNRQQLLQHMPVANMIKCLAVYRKAFWRTNGFSGQAVMLCKPYSKGPLCATFDATTCNGTPALLGFIGGEHALYWSQKTDKERKEAILSSFVALYGEEAKSELVSYQEKDWSKEEYNGGCPVNFMQPGCLVYFEHILREPFGRIHWAGTETAFKWMGYIDGAAEAGERAAEEVYNRLMFPDKPGARQDTSNTATSPVFNSNSKKQESKFGRYTRALVVGAVLGGVGYYLYRKYERS